MRTNREGDYRVRGRPFVVREAAQQTGIIGDPGKADEGPGQKNERKRQSHTRQRRAPTPHQREPHHERPQEELQRHTGAYGGRGPPKALAPVPSGRGGQKQKRADRTEVDSAAGEEERSGERVTA